MTEVNLAETISPNSDQLNADDLIAGPRTFTISDVSKGDAEQPAYIHLAEIPGRSYRPSKSMRRVLVSGWGGKGSTYIGRRITLYRDPEVTFGRDKVGGIKISHMSDLNGKLTVPLTVSRGKKANHTVDPLPPALTEPTADQVAESTDGQMLRDWWHVSGDERRAQIQTRVAELEIAS